jgi:hypothetical protein
MSKIKSHDEYIARLNAHDWYYQYSDCNQTYRAGMDEEGRLLDWARIHDPELTLYYAHDKERQAFYAAQAAGGAK